MTLLLFAETPRFSNEGHRFLVPVGERPQESMLAGFAEASLTGRPGANYLAATKRATQVLDNGTVRDGNELLVLAGLDVARLTRAQVLTVHDWLYAKLDSLSQGGPGKPTTRLVIERPFLNEWLEDPKLKHLATTDWAQGPRLLQDAQHGIFSASSPARATVRCLIGSVLLFLGGMAADRWPPSTWPAILRIDPTKAGRTGKTDLPGDAVSGVDSGVPPTAAGPPCPIRSSTDDEVYKNAKAEEEEKDTKDRSLYNEIL